jgi:hypothetical protein
MAKELDEKTQALVDKAFARGAKEERTRINNIVRDATTDAGEIEDRAHKKAVKDALSTVKSRIKDEAGA